MSNENIKNLKKIAILSIMTGLSIILNYVELLFPINIGFVGIKVGLANIVTILLLKYFGVYKTIIVNIIRLIVIGVLFSSIVRFAMSVSGFVLSFIVLYMLIVVANANVILSSAFAGVCHNIGQILALSIFTNNAKVLYLIFPYIIAGIITGAFVGIVAIQVDNSAKKLSLFKQ